MNKAKIVVYKACIKDVDVAMLYDRFKDKMTDERLARINKAQSKAAIKSIICTGAITAVVLDKYLVYKDMIVSSSCGKPYIMGRDDLFFNVSNSGDYVAIAVSDREVGLDIQKPVDVSDSLIKKVISLTDRERFKDLIETSFNAIWAIKEAYVKLTGEGISRELSGISFEAFNEMLNIYDEGVLKAKGALKRIDDEYSLAVASYADFEMDFFDVDLNKR